MKLAIAIPSVRDWKAAFGSSLIGLVRYLERSGVDYDMNLMQGTSVLPRARQLAIDWANSIKATHLLCLDDDMKFTPDVIASLIERNLEIVACNYVAKGNGKPLVHDIDGKQISSSERLGVQEVGWVGFGVVLMKLESIKDIPAPLFETRWLPERNDFMGEDFYFCGKVRAHGVKIHVDHDASQKVGHVGDFDYRESA